MSTLLLILIKYKYLILFPVVVAEGPFATVISGFLISQGIFNIFIAYPIIIFGDLVSDSIFYFIGRLSGNTIHKGAKYLGVTEEKLKKAKSYFTKNSTRAIVASKFIHGVGISGLMAAGILKIKYWKYVKVCVMTDLLQFSALLAIGYFFGHAYKKIAVYLDEYAKIVSIIVIVLVLVVIAIYKFNRKDFDK